MDKNKVMAAMSAQVDNNLNLDSGSSATSNFLQMTGGSSTDVSSSMSCWRYWQDYYYPYVIRDSYPTYIESRARDKGREAFEIIKMLRDTRFLKLETVGDFIELMDKLIKIL